MKKGLVIFLLILYFVTNVVIIVKAEDSLNLHALSGILIERESGRVLWALNPYEERSMASTTKIMTCIVALENGNLDDLVTVSKLAASAQPVKLYIKPGETYRLEDLLYALMLQSSNDVAVAIAEHVGGSVDEFCRMMTEKANEIGALSTSYKTPNGLDANGHYSTAYDLALIANYALSNERFLEIINTSSWQITRDNGNSRVIGVTNKNNFLYSYDGAYGVKTGFTNKAGYCFVGASEQNGMDLISVVLGSGWPPNRNYKWSDTRKIMNHGYAKYQLKPVLKDDVDFDPVTVIKGKEQQVDTYIDGMLNLPLCEDDEVNIKYKLAKEVNAPIKENEILGIATVYLNGEINDSFYICAKKGIEREDMRYNFERVLSGWCELFAS